jgi:hypothetical protein
LKALVGVREQRDIEKLVAKILRDLGNPDPPLNLQQVRELLSVDIKYYSSADVGLFKEFAHRIKIANKQLIARPGLLLDVLKKANLAGLWLPDNRRIFIDERQPKPKHRWIEAHEITHSYVPWHAEFLLGDDELTLNPECHEIIEAEANFGAGNLLFLGRRFAREARDMPDGFDAIKNLKTRYGNTLTSTFWRFVEDRTPDRTVFGLISRHPRHSFIGTADEGEDVHHFIGSKAFRERFSRTSASDIYAIVGRLATWKKAGPVFKGVEVLFDDNGQAKEFVFEGFCNSYDLLTYCYPIS